MGTKTRTPLVDAQPVPSLSLGWSLFIESLRIVVSILVLENEWVTVWAVDSYPLLRTCVVLAGGLHTLFAEGKKPQSLPARKPCLVGLIIIHTKYYVQLRAQEKQKNL